MSTGAASLLRCLDAETAHGFAMSALRHGLVWARPVVDDPRLAVDALGLRFPNPLGMAAGFDKNAVAPDPLLRLGFGFVEVGTITPLPQEGNPRPRIFRLAEDRAVINRLGFNNDGHAAVERRLAARRDRPGIVGVNIGANKDASDRVADYVAGIRRFAPYASYLAINVSSPNTPGLRDLQAHAALDELLARVVDARDGASASVGRRVPLLVKIAPDVSDSDLDAIASVCATRRIDGLIVCNTTLSRSGVTSPLRREQGGLSGRPLFARSTIVLARMRQRLGPQMTLIGVGGVFDASDVATKIAAGADLVQVYTGFVYGGSSLPGRIVAGLSDLLTVRGIASIKDLRDTTTEATASRDLADEDR
jgi:dihydroorotate dehydrogenase